MSSPRRIAGPDAKNRIVLLEAAEQLMAEEGYAAVTSRRVAARAGLKPQLVHYYFRTMDDLFLELLQRRADQGLELHAQVLASPQPLRALWEFSSDPAAVLLNTEFMALANHRKTIGAEIAKIAERYRAAEVAALEEILRRYGVPAGSMTAAALSVIMVSISRVITIERSVGMSTGHAETLELLESWLHRVEGSVSGGDT